MFGTYHWFLSVCVVDLRNENLQTEQPLCVRSMVECAVILNISKDQKFIKGHCII